jgi:ribosomal protein L11 methyltransferase
MTTMTDQPLYVVQLQGAPEAIEVVADLLAGEEVNHSTWRHPAEPLAWLYIYADTPAEAAAREEQVRARLADWAEFLPGAVALQPVRELAREDWAESWKRFFKPRRVSPRVVIKPSWEPWDAAPGEVVIDIDPGMSFGTGQHGTTAACITLLDELAQQGHAGGPGLDIGCGSGILSIAAARFGWGPLTAYDCDPIAVTATAENAARNGVAHRITVQAGDLTTWPVTPTYPLVLANILAEVLIRHPREVAGQVAATGPGWLILSGILTPQFESVAAAYAPLGFALRRSLTLDEWTTGLFARR